MKTARITLSVILLILALIMLGAYFANAATTEQEKKILQNIDDICGDAWCEGQQDFHFNDLRITGDKATLYYEVADTSNVETESDYDQLIFVEATCTFTIDKDDVNELSSETMDELSECFDNPEYTPYGLAPEKKPTKKPDTVPNPFK